jgi:hypothetical protein
MNAPRILHTAATRKAIPHAPAAFAVGDGLRASATSREDGAVTAAPDVIFVDRFFAPDLCATSRLLSDLAFRLACRGLSNDPAARLAPMETVRGRTRFLDRENDCGAGRRGRRRPAPRW